MECATENVLRFDVSTRTVPHISAGVSLIGSQILIEWSVPDITKVCSLGHFTCSCCCTNGLFIKHRVTSFTCAYHSLQASSFSTPLLERTQGLLGEMRLVFYPSFLLRNGSRISSFLIYCFRTLAHICGGK